MSEKKVVFVLTVEHDPGALPAIETIETKLQAIHDRASIELKLKLDDSVETSLKTVEDRLAKLHERSELTLKMKIDSSVEAAISQVEQRLDALQQKASVNVGSGTRGRATKAPSASTAKAPKIPRMRTPSRKVPTLPGMKGKAASFVANGLIAGFDSFGGYGGGQHADFSLGRMGEVFGGEAGTIDTFNKWGNSFSGNVLDSIDDAPADIPAARMSMAQRFKADFYDGAAMGSDIGTVGGPVGMAGGSLVGGLAYGSTAWIGRGISGTSAAEEEYAQSWEREQKMLRENPAIIARNRSIEDDRIADLRESQRIDALNRSNATAKDAAMFGGDMQGLRLMDNPETRLRRLNEINDRNDGERTWYGAKAQEKLREAATIEQSMKHGNVGLGDADDVKALYREAEDLFKRMNQENDQLKRGEQERLKIVEEINTGYDKQIHALERQKELATRDRERLVDKQDDARERFARMDGLEQTTALRAKSKADKGEKLSFEELDALDDLGSTPTLERLRKQSSAAISKSYGFDKAFGADFSKETGEIDKKIEGIDAEQDRVESLKKAGKDTAGELANALAETLKEFIPAFQVVAEQTKKDIRDQITSKAYGA